MLKFDVESRGSILVMIPLNDETGAWAEKNWGGKYCPGESAWIKLPSEWEAIKELFQKHEVMFNRVIF